MVARVFRSLAFRSLAPALAALGLLALRPAVPCAGRAAAVPAGGEVVFRHYV